jgi:superfamily II DNA or RNA helicase
MAFVSCQKARPLTPEIMGLSAEGWQMLPSEPGDRSQKLHDRLAVGARVRVRGAVWLVNHVHPFDSCTIVQLTGIGRENAGQPTTLIDPFDRLQPEQAPATLRVVRKTEWGRAFKELLALDHPFDGLRAAAFARIELLPFQLEPALALVRGLASRVLLADEVGLGKTIQAGLLLAELRERGLAERALLLTPAGLREQWKEELHTRFGIAATVVDSLLLRRRGSLLPASTNPWLLDDVAIASIDLVKRAEALRSMASIVWDVLVLDEAHVVAHAPLRHAALRQLAARARRVVLISATPYAGDSSAFAALCRLGAGDDQPLIMFRRSRIEVGLAVNRRSRTIRVNLGSNERQLHRLMRAYALLVCRENDSTRSHTQARSVLAMTVLTKRALSSPVSLRLSVERRIQLLATDEEPPVDFQPWLPFSDDEQDHRDLEPLEILKAPGLADRARELTILQDIELAAREVPIGRKVHVLMRFLARVKEPVVVFTEYRDTLQHVARMIGGTTGISIIHGGLGEAERLKALAEFATGETRVLLATDAAGEGLNLHHRCRLVINLELPWNPMRLEQRIGRVDRLGQRRRVHAINLVARDTSEEAILRRLAGRLARVQHAIGRVNNPLGAVDELVEAMLTHGGDTDEIQRDAIPQLDLRAVAIDETRRLTAVRRLARQPTNMGQEMVRVTTLGRAQVGGLVPSSSLVCLVRLRLVGGDGELVEQLLVPLVAPFSLSAVSRHVIRRPKNLRSTVRLALDEVWTEMEMRALAVAKVRRNTIISTYQAAVEARRVRELSIVRNIETGSHTPSPFQPRLFDSRSLRDRAAALQSHAISLGNEFAQVRTIDQSHEIVIAEPTQLALVLVVV